MCPPHLPQQRSNLSYTGRICVTYRYLWKFKISLFFLQYFDSAGCILTPSLHAFMVSTSPDMSSLPCILPLMWSSLFYFERLDRGAESPSLLVAYNFLIDFTWELRQLWCLWLTDKCELIKPPGLPWKKLLIHWWWCSGYHSLDRLPISTGFEFSMSPLMDFFFKLISTWYNEYFIFTWRIFWKTSFLSSANINEEQNTMISKSQPHW